MEDLPARSDGTAVGAVTCAEMDNSRMSCQAARREQYGQADHMGSDLAPDAACLQVAANGVSWLHHLQKKKHCAVHHTVSVRSDTLQDVASREVASREVA